MTKNDPREDGADEGQAPLGGVFPGGPSRGRAPVGKAPEVHGSEWRQARADAKRLRHRSRRKNRTQWTIIMVVMVFAGLSGYLLGRNDPREESNPETNSESAIDPAVSRELNRLMLELWKMESLETGRDR